MHRISVFACAFSTCLAISSAFSQAAEAVETAIAEWIAAVDSAPDWSATVDGVTYEPATDTAVVTGLTISNATTNLILSFQPVSIAGYAEAGDGTFGADFVVSDGLTATGDGFEATISGIRYEGLQNFARNVGELVRWDPERPFTSLVQAYARFLDIRLARSTIDALSMTIEEHGEKVDIAYEDAVLEDWADGRIARVSTGPIAIAGAGIEEPFTIGINGTEAFGIDYASFLRIYDPDQYVGGVGDGIWRNAVELIRYDTITLESPEAEVAFGELRLEDFRVRQPERSFAELLDRAMLDPDRTDEPTPDEMREIFGYLSSFAIGSMSLKDVAVAAEDGGTGHLGEMRLVDVSVERLEEFSLSDINVAAPDGGRVNVGRLSVGGLVFPPLTALLEAAQAEEAGEEFDYAKLATQLAYFEARGIDVDVPENPRFKLANARLDLANYVGAIPTFVAFEIAGADLPASAIEDPTAQALWQALGYDRIRVDIGARMAWNEDDERIAIDDFRFSIDEVGALSFSAVFEGITREALIDYERMPEIMAGVSFVRGALALDNYDVLDRWIDQQAAMTGNDPVVLRKNVALMLAELASGVGDSNFQSQLRRILETAAMVPGSITVTAKPSAPVPLIALGVLAQTAPTNLPTLLGITIENTPSRSR